jgi:hypothetical protein
MAALPAPVQKIKDRTDALVEEMKKADKTEKDKAVKETKENIEPGPIPTVKEPEHQEEKKPPVKTETEETWEHKYKVLQGKYNEEVKAIKDDVSKLTSLKSQVRTLTQRLNEEDAVIRGLRAKLEQKETTPPPTPKKVEMPESVMSLLSDEERSHFEEEGIDNKSVEIIGKIVKDLVSRIQPDNSQSIDLEEIKKNAAVAANAVVAIEKDREKVFLEKLSDAVIDWETINTSIDFNDWLDVSIPYMGITRRDAIKSAHQALDYKNVIKMFDDFLKMQPKKAKPKPLKIDPEEHIEPTSTVAPPEPPVGKTSRIYTRQEITQFYQDYALGKFSKEEGASIDADIMKANRERRITN